jgi:hypothetical protein
MSVDVLGREIKQDDFVVYYSKLYQVQRIFPVMSNNFVRIILVEKAKTTKAVNKLARECCLVDKDEVLIYLLKNGKV